MSANDFDKGYSKGWQDCEKHMEQDAREEAKQQEYVDAEEAYTSED